MSTTTDASTLDLCANVPTGKSMKDTSTADSSWFTGAHAPSPCDRQSHRPRRPSSLVGSRLWWILHLRIISPPFQAHWSENGYGEQWRPSGPASAEFAISFWWGRDENGMRERGWRGDTQRSKWRLKPGMTFKSSQVFRYLIIGTARTAAVPRAPPPPPPSNVCFQALWLNGLSRRLSGGLKETAIQGS